jgi:hypothetical protein
MTTTRRFRPTLSAALEGRTVPSGFGGSRGLAALLNPTGASDVQSVNTAVRQFEVSLVQDVVKDLYGGGAGTPSSTTQATFNADVTSLVSGLSTTLTSDVSNLNSTTLNSTISGDLSTLQTSLTGLALPGAGFRSELRFIHQALSDVESTLSSIDSSIINTMPAGAVTVAQVQSLQSTIASAFQTFASSFSTTPSNLSAELTTLTNTITQSSSFTALPSTVQSSLTASLGTLTTNLQTSLSGLTPPTSGNRGSQWLFNHLSAFSIRTTEAQFLQDVVTQSASYNTTLS